MTDMSEPRDLEEERDGKRYCLTMYAGLWVAYRMCPPQRGWIALCAPSSYEFAHERFVAGKRTDEEGEV